MSLGTDMGQKKISVPKIVIVSATKLRTMLGVDNYQDNVAGS